MIILHCPLPRSPLPFWASWVLFQSLLAALEACLLVEFVSAFGFQGGRWLRDGSAAAVLLCACCMCLGRRWWWQTELDSLPRCLLASWLLRHGQHVHSGPLTSWPLDIQQQVPCAWQRVGCLMAAFAAAAQALEQLSLAHANSVALCVTSWAAALNAAWVAEPNVQRLSFGAAQSQRCRSG